MDESTPISTPGDRFVGRAAELERLNELVDDGPVTIVGPPGVGKTRLSLEFAASSDRDITRVELAHISTRKGLALELTNTLGLVVGTAGDESREDEILAAVSEMGGRVWILDNLEQLEPDAVSLIPRLREANPDLKMVCTSQRPLGVEGENLLELEPLSTSDAVELLMARARERGAGAHTGASKELLGALVESLDRLPLAVELTAGRLTIMKPDAILKRLEERLTLLRHSERVVENPRHHGLESAIGWSWDLLDDDERSCLTQVCVFRGGFDVDAAEAVVEVEGSWPPDIIQRLVARSLLTTGDGRISMLESVRSYAMAKGERVIMDGARARHALYFATRGYESNALLWSERFEAAMDWVTREAANLRAVLEHESTSADLRARAAVALDTHPFRDPRLLTLGDLESFSETLDDEVRARMDLALGRMHRLAGTSSDAMDHLERAIGSDPGTLELATLARIELTKLLQERGESERALQCVKRACDDAANAEQSAIHASALECRGVTEFFRGSHHVGRQVLHQALKLVTPAERHPAQHATLLFRLAVLEMFSGESAESFDYLNEASEIFRRLSFEDKEARVYNYLARAHMDLGDLELCRDFANRSLEINQRTGNLRYQAEDHYCIGCAHLYMAEHAAARASLTRAEAISERIEAHHLLAGVWLMRALLEFETGNASLALELIERASSMSGSLQDANQAFAFGTRAAILAFEGRHDEAITALSRARAAGERADAGLWDRFLETASLVLELLADQPDRLDEARELADSIPALDEASKELVETRVMANLLRRAIDQIGPVERPFEIALDGTWFRTPSGEKVDLARRSKLRRVLARLARNHAEASSESIDVWALLEAGWPDTKIDPESGAQRVYTTVWQLRKAGLEDLLVKDGDGYVMRGSLKIVD